MTETLRRHPPALGRSTSQVEKVAPIAESPLAERVSVLVLGGEVPTGYQLTTPGEIARCLSQNLAWALSIEEIADAHGFALEDLTDDLGCVRLLLQLRSARWL